MLWKEDQSPRVEKERKPVLRGKWESVSSGKHMDSVPEETHVVSVMTQWPLAAVALVRDEKDDRLLPHPSRKQNRLTVREATKRRILTKEVRFCVDKNCKRTRRVRFAIFPCVRMTSLTKDVFLATEAEENPKKVKQRWCKRIVCDIEGVYKIGLCISRFLSEKVSSA